MTYQRIAAGCVLFAIVCAGCGVTATPSPGVQPATPTSLPVATATSLPTATPPPAPTATAPPTATPTPSPTPGIAKRVTFTPGQVVDVQPGIFFADIATGAIEGWQLPLDTAGGWGNQIALASISSRGRFILYPTKNTPGDRNWKLLDTQTGRTCPLPDVRDPVWDDLFSPDEQTFVANTTLGIALLRSDCTGSPQPLKLRVDEQLGYTVWSPDRKALLLVTQRPGPDPESGSLVTSYLINQSLKEPVVVEQGQGRLIRPDWFPDGAHFVVVSPSWGKVQALDQTGRVLWATSLPATFLGNPRWSPDERSIGLQADVYAESEGRTRYMSYVYVLDAETGRTRFRVVGAGACGQNWTADGRSLLVWSYHSNGNRYHLVAADGSALRQIDPDPRGYFAFLDLSPKEVNRGVVHQWATALGQESLKGMDLTTGRLTALLDSRVGLSWSWGHPSRLWLSDGRLAFSTPAKAMGGPACIRDMLLPEFRIEFPPFPEV